MKLKDRVALVTGAGRGIGEETALALANEGAKVIVCDIDPDLAKEVSKKITSNGGEAIVAGCNVANSDEVEKMVNASLERFDRIDILVNNAGIRKKENVFFTELTEEQWDRTIEVNLKGVFLCSRTVAKEMVRQKYGRIINISSVAGQSGEIIGHADYATSKAGIIGLTNSMASELGEYGITVNSIAPGVILTDMTRNLLKDLGDDLLRQIPLKRYGKPEEVAGVVVFLSSEEAGYITGYTLGVSGGFLRH